MCGLSSEDANYIVVFWVSHLLVDWVKLTQFELSLLDKCTRGVMIHLEESILESNHGHFLRLHDSDSDSNSI